MTAEIFWNHGIRFLRVCAAYYVIQLVRCALLSFAVYALVFILRKTVLKNKVFLKGALWSLFIPVLFIGKMKFFYESGIGKKLFSWLTRMCMNHVWICYLYLCGVFLYAALFFYRRSRLKKIIAVMEKRTVEDTVVYVTKMPVTPSTAGVLRPKIIMPEVILKEYDRKEVQMILLHEKTHIRLGHLLFYFLWDLLRGLLWLNPFLAMGTKYFREDMEEICDWAAMKRSGENAYEYGLLLLKSMRILQAESEDFNMYAAFAGDKEYQNVRQRVKRIAGYKRYKRTAAMGTAITAMLLAAAAVFCIKSVSYGRYNLLDSITVYDMGTGTELVSDEAVLRDAVSFDENSIYIKPEKFQELIKERHVSSENICFYLGGYYKLPGISGGGGRCGYLKAAEYKDGILQIEYDRQEDIFERVLKVI